MPSGKLGTNFLLIAVNAAPRLLSVSLLADSSSKSVVFSWDFLTMFLYSFTKEQKLYILTNKIEAKVNDYSIYITNKYSEHE